MRDGNEAVPIGTVVEYHGSMGRGTYTITDHAVPVNRGVTESELEAAYPDGVAYELWPLGVKRKFDNRHLARYNVRRGSFTATEEST